MFSPCLGKVRLLALAVYPLWPGTILIICENHMVATSKLMELILLSPGRINIFKEINFKVGIEIKKVFLFFPCCHGKRR